jgi:hypothetical protein
MRKLIFATLLTLALAAPAATAAPRERDNPRDRETPIVRIIRAIKRLITNGDVSIPIP